MSSIKDHPLYSIWEGIRKRTDGRGSRRSVHYARLGIKTSNRWKGKGGFLNFVDDMGPRPSKHHTIDRINPLGDYEPSNCRWATRKEQLTNRRHNPARFVTINGIEDSVRQHCKRLGKPYPTVKKRILRGWDPIKAITTPPHKKLS